MHRKKTFPTQDDEKKNTKKIQVTFPVVQLKLLQEFFFSSRPKTFSFQPSYFLGGNSIVLKVE